jgi:hypothetical protein
MVAETWDLPFQVFTTTSGNLVLNETNKKSGKFQQVREIRTDFFELKNIEKSFHL